MAEDERMRMNIFRLAPVPIIILGILTILRDLTLDDLLSFSLDLTAALIALLVFKLTDLHRNILDDRRVISASPFNLSRGLARPFADLIKKIVKGRRARNHSISALPKLEEVFADYIEKECLPPENTIKDKLFIVFAESEEEVCTVKKLKEIERNSPSEDGRRERISISVNPVSPRSYQDHRCERSGNYFPIKIEVMKIRRFGDDGSRRDDQYIFFFENRPLRTLYMMKDDARIKFEKQDLDYHFQLFYDSLNEMLKEDEEVNRVVKLIKFKYREKSLKFTDELRRGIVQSSIEEGILY